MHTDDQIERAARLAETGEPVGPMDDTADLRELADAAESVVTANARVRELVETARAAGRSWGQIGIALGVSRQAARQRFGEKVVAMSEYLVILERSATGWGGWSPDLGVYATGATKDETIEQIRDAIAFHIEGLREAGDPIPEPSVDSVLVAEHL